MRCVKIVGDAFAICDDDEVIAVVSKCSDTQWGIYPLVACQAIGFPCYIPLHYALEGAMKLVRI